MQGQTLERSKGAEIPQKLFLVPLNPQNTLLSQ